MVNIDTLMRMDFLNGEEDSPIQNILERILCATIYVLRHLWSIDMDLSWDTDVEEYAKQYGTDKADELIMMVTNLYEKYQIQEMYPYFNNNPQVIFGLISIIEEGIENQLLEEETGASILGEIMRLSRNSATTDLYMNLETISRWVRRIDEGEGEDLLEELENIDSLEFYGN